MKALNYWKAMAHVRTDMSLGRSVKDYGFVLDTL